MPKMSCLIVALSLYSIINNQAFARESDTPSLVNISIDYNTSQAPLNFKSDNTATIDIPKNSANKNFTISLPPGSKGNILVPACNNATITSSNTANCVLPTSMTSLTLVDNKADAFNGLVSFGFVFGFGLSMIAQIMSINLGCTAAVGAISWLASAFYTLEEAPLFRS